MKMGFAGEYSFVVSGGQRGTVKLAEMSNVITDIGLDRIGVGGVGQFCRVGAGNRPAETGDSSLVSQIAHTDGIHARTTFYEPGPPPRSAIRVTYRFGKGAAKGTLSEVGIGWANGGDTLWSRALIKDEDGEPLSITILADEVLDVIYTLYMYLDLNDDVKQFVYKGINRKATTRFNNVKEHSFMHSVFFQGLPTGSGGSYQHSNIGGAKSVLGDVYTSASLSPGANTSYYGYRSLEAYVNGSYERVIKWMIPDTSWTSDNLISVMLVWPHHGNAWGWGGALSAKTQFEPPLEKDYTEEFTYIGKIKWGRYVPPPPDPVVP